MLVQSEWFQLQVAHWIHVMSRTSQFSPVVQVAQLFSMFRWFQKHVFTLTCHARIQTLTGFSALTHLHVPRTQKVTLQPVLAVTEVFMSEL